MKKKPNYLIKKDGFVKFASDSFEAAARFYNDLRIEYPDSDVLFIF